MLLMLHLAKFTCVALIGHLSNPEFSETLPTLP